jgi:hypothetical protein
MAQLAPLNDPVTGVLHADAGITGSLSKPDALLTVTGRDISAAGLQGVSVEATGRVFGDTAEMSAFTAHAANGTITAHGQASLAGGAGVIRLDWRQLDLATLMRRVLRRDSILLAARFEGSADAQWSAPRIDALRIRSEARLIAPGGDSVSGRALPIEGSAAFNLQQQRWTLRTEQTVNHSAHATADVGGSLGRPNLSRSSLAGDVRIGARIVSSPPRWLARGWWPPRPRSAAWRRRLLAERHDRRDASPRRLQSTDLNCGRIGRPRHTACARRLPRSPRPY